MELGLTLGGANKSTNLALGLGVNPGERHGGSRSDDHRSVAIQPHRMNLDLLPLWPSHETANTGSSEGFDVNRVPATETEEAEAVSSPNSVASSFQVDFCIYGGERKRSFTDERERAICEQGERTTSSRASDDDENCHTRKKLRLSKEQAAFLEESFKEHHTLNPKQKQELAKQLGLKPRQVEVWFQNRRARTKLKQTEVDCEYLKRCCETLTEENRRLHKELQELRTLKSSTPYYMQRPATTLTMCPSCERTTTTTNNATVPATTPNIGANSSVVATSKTVDPSSKTAPFPLSRPKFFPFSSHTNQPQKSVAS